MINAFKTTRTNWGVSTKIIETKGGNAFFFNIKSYESTPTVAEAREVGLTLLSGEAILELYNSDGSMKSRSILKDDNNKYAVVPEDTVFRISAGEDPTIVLAMYSK